MGVRENKVETYLDDRAKALGGLTRKWVSPGRDGVPDRIMFLPGGRIIFVEVKTTGGKVSGTQEREIARLMLAGASVCIIYGRQAVDQLFQFLDLMPGLPQVCKVYGGPTPFEFQEALETLQELNGEKDLAGAE